MRNIVTYTWKTNESLKKNTFEKGKITSNEKTLFIRLEVPPFEGGKEFTLYSKFSVTVQQKS